MLQVPDTTLVTMLSQRGVSEAQTHALIATFKASPLYGAGVKMTSQAKQLECMLSLFRRSYESWPDAHQVATMTMNDPELTPALFLERHYSAGRPLLITQFADSWPAMTEWTWDNLTQRHGHLAVEMVEQYWCGDEHKVRYEPIQFDAYVERVLAAEGNNDIYLTAYNSGKCTGLLMGMAPDMVMPEGYCTPEVDPKSVFLWIGPQGSLTQLHFDPYNVLLTQVVGHKRVYLMPPTVYPYVMVKNDFFAQFNPDDPDFTTFPQAQNCPILTCEIGPGDALFIPAGWFHQVKALDKSISVSLTNMVWPNQYEPFSHMFPEFAEPCGHGPPSG